MLILFTFRDNSFQYLNNMFTIVIFYSQHYSLIITELSTHLKYHKLIIIICILNDN